MTKTKWMCGLLALLMLLPLSLLGCKHEAGMGENLMEGITPVATLERATDESFAQAITAFGLDLFKTQFREDENVLLSPLSVYIALSMTAGGARGETLREMESVLGLSSDSLHEYIKTYTDNLSSNEKAKLSIANSIWFRDDERLAVSPDFLALNGGYYGAEARKVPFDKETVKAVNRWVEEKTDGMIDELVDENTFTKYTMLCLLNAIAFDAKWVSPYEESQMREEIFHAISGAEEKAEMMYEWGSSFLESDSATGFIKPYEGGRYAFMAILPDEDVNFAEYAKSFDAAEYGTLWKSRISLVRYDVHTGLPKFSYEFSTDLAEALSSMGMPTAFSPRGDADFSGMLAPESQVEKLFISSVIHKTFIELTEAGTKAAAVTAVIMTECTGYDPVVPERREVILDRPFLYAIVDTQTGIPLFFGSVTSVG